LININNRQQGKNGMTDETNDTVSAGKNTTAALTDKQRRLVSAATEISTSDPDDVEFIHATFAQVALPRSRTSGREFYRRFGSVNIHLQAGVTERAGQLVPRPLPYGTPPRKFLIHATTWALRNRTCEIPLGSSMRDLMMNCLGYKHVSGGKNGSMTSLKRQLYALVASRITLGWQKHGRDITQKVDIFQRLEDPAFWYEDVQGGLFPATALLSADYLAAIQEHAFPVDPRAIRALESALAVDIYVWLAYRLRKIARGKPLPLSYAAAKAQFGEDYRDPKNFKKKFNIAMRDALMVYPDARVESVEGGFDLYHSRPPIAERVIVPVGLASPPRRTEFA
jgi:hypothetical protein